jgi:L-lactate permease
MAAIPVDLPQTLVNNLQSLIILFQAIGGLIIAYIIFNIINLIRQRRNSQEIKEIRGGIKRIEEKLNKIREKR